MVSGNEPTKLPPSAGDEFEYLENSREISRTYPTGNSKGAVRWIEKTTRKSNVFCPVAATSSRKHMKMESV